MAPVLIHTGIGIAGWQELRVTNHRLRQTTASGSKRVTALVGVFLARSYAHQFVVFLILRGRPNHLPDIETGRLPLENKFVERDPRSRIHFWIVNRYG